MSSNIIPQTSANNGGAWLDLLDRERGVGVEIDGALYTLTIDPEGLKLVPKGRRKGHALAWRSFIDGEAALAAMGPELSDLQERLWAERTAGSERSAASGGRTPASSGTEGSVSGVEGLPTGSALLVVKRGPNAGSRFLLDQATTSAGRHPDSDIFLDDVTVSRRHAEFVREGDEFLVRDIGSLNGTYVNRNRIEKADLSDGDEVQVGKYRLVFFAGHEGN